MGHKKGVKFRKKENIKRFFYPNEYNKFISVISEKMKFYFDFLLQTGMRHNEAYYVKIKDIDFERNTITVTHAKTRIGGIKKIKILCPMCKEKIYLSKNLSFCSGCGNKIENIDDIILKYKNIIINRRRDLRKVRISEEFRNKISNRIKNLKLKQEDTFNFPTRQGMRQLMHRKLKEINILDWQDISPHNLRKTHENYLLATGSNILSIRMQMGHSIDIAVAYYISNNTFTLEEIGMIKLIMGNLKL